MSLYPTSGYIQKSARVRALQYSQITNIEEKSSIVLQPGEASDPDGITTYDICGYSQRAYEIKKEARARLYARQFVPR